MKRQNMFGDDEKRVRNGDRPFTKAKRSNCDVLDQNELQTYASLEKMLHKTIFAIQQLKKKGKTNTSSAPKQQCKFSSLSNFDLKTNVFSFDKSKAVKPTSKAHSTRCFKCHRTGHYANKCLNQKPLVTLENENVETEPKKEGLLPIFDDYAHKLMAKGGNDAPRIEHRPPRIVDPGQDDATMAETADSSTKDKPRGLNGEYTDLKPAGETEDELKQSVHELEPAEESVH
uniref:CCHC-type domain-containing protein n=1 Tax=Brassica oleracea TaxID=3712 RepID=A0A3P6ENK5_BRAOL|nr:unnamed protein product [Brassica oleracea]